MPALVQSQLKLIILAISEATELQHGEGPFDPPILLPSAVITSKEVRSSLEVWNVISQYKHAANQQAVMDFHYGLMVSALTSRLL